MRENAMKEEGKDLRTGASINRRASGALRHSSSFYFSGYSPSSPPQARAFPFISSLAGTLKPSYRATYRRRSVSSRPRERRKLAGDRPRHARGILRFYSRMREIAMKRRLETAGLFARVRIRTKSIYTVRSRRYN